MFLVGDKLLFTLTARSQTGHTYLWSCVVRGSTDLKLSTHRCQSVQQCKSYSNSQVTLGAMFMIDHSEPHNLCPLLIKVQIVHDRHYKAHRSLREKQSVPTQIWEEVRSYKISEITCVGWTCCRCAEPLMQETIYVGYSLFLMVLLPNMNYTPTSLFAITIFI